MLWEKEAVGTDRVTVGIGRTGGMPSGVCSAKGKKFSLKTTCREM